MAGPDPRPFSSDLSVGGFALVRHAGVTALTQVMGCDIRVAQDTLPPIAEQPIITRPGLERCFDETRRTAFDRLAQEAERAGANAVLGVRRLPAAIEFERDRRRGRGRTTSLYVQSAVDYQLIGTAVHDPALPAGRSAASTLSAEAYYKLKTAGRRPVGVVGGCGFAWWDSTAAGSSRGSQAGYAQLNYVSGELPFLGELYNTAWRRASERMLAEVAELGGDGVIAVQVEHERHELEWEAPYIRSTGKPSRDSFPHHGLLVGCRMLGTAVIAAGTPAHQVPMLVLGLGDRR